MPDINGIPYVESTDLVSGWPTVSQSVAQEVSDQLASKQADVMTTKGDLAAYGTAVARLGVGTNGQVLTADSGETLGVKWANSGGGLTLITAESFSAVSAVNINSCFTSDYTIYRLLAKTTHSTGAEIRFRMRASASDDTGNVYTRQGLWGESSTTTAGTSTGTNGFLYDGNTTTEFAIASDIYEPQTTNQTYLLTTFRSARPGVGLAGAFVNTTTSYDGISVYPSTGTFSGEIRVYGYKD